MAKTERARENKKIRQDALRDKLVAGGHVQHVVDIADKLADTGIKLDSSAVMRMKAAADIKMKLINKYLPDLKAVEVTHDDDDEVPELNITFTVKEPIGDIKVTHGKPKP